MNRTRRHLLLSHRQSAGFALLAAVLAVCVCGAALSRGRVEAITEEHRLATLLNVNQATPEELQLLPGIGAALAERIVLLREERQRFDSLDELRDVSGIGAIRLEQIRPHIIAE
jgi:competence ComEA-like helix-hairpin-helix protein